MSDPKYVSKISVFNIHFKSDSDKEVLYEIVNKETEDKLVGEYGNFTSCIIGVDKNYIDEFPLIFEDQEHAEFYLFKYLEVYNRVSPDKDHKDASDYEIRETKTCGFGQILTFDIIK